MEAQHLCSVGATLGEGPVWIGRENALWFVDIKAPCAYRFDPETGTLERFASPEQVGWVLPAQGGRFLAGLRTGLHSFAPDEDGAFVLHAEVEPQHPGNRLNDAAVDPEGRVWFGSMHNGETDRTGNLYRWQDGVVTPTGAAPVVITNGPAISPDGKTLYAVDTLGLEILAYPIDPDGTLGAPTPFVTIDPADGHPDGAIADSEGGIWIGLYGGWAAHRYAPDGSLTDVVRFPVANITKIALGGPDGRTAYATTARQGLDAAALAAQPLAGDLFTFRVAVPGVPVPEIDLV